MLALFNESICIRISIGRVDWGFSKYRVERTDESETQTFEEFGGSRIANDNVDVREIAGLGHSLRHINCHQRGVTFTAMSVHREKSAHAHRCVAHNP